MTQPFPMPAGLNRLGTLAAVAAALCLPTVARSQVLDDLEVRREGDDAVLVVRFASDVLLQRSITARSGDIVIASYQLVTVTNSRLEGGARNLRLPTMRGLPRLQVSDEADRGEQNRRIVLRSDVPLAMVVRAPRGRRALEVVLKGQGAALQALDESSRPALVAQPTPLAPTVPTAPMPTAPATPAIPPSAVAPSPSPSPTPSPSSSPTPTPAAQPAATPPPDSPARVPEENADADAWMERARSARAAGNTAAAVEALQQLLELPPNRHTEAAQELLGRLYLTMGDAVRARAELQTFLRLYPRSPAAAGVRELLAGLPAERPAAAGDRAAAAPRSVEVTTSGSTSMTGYGGNGRVRSREFLESPIAGLPQQPGDATLSGDRSQQLYNDVDLSWRRRGEDSEQRFLLRDAYTTDLDRPEKNRNRLSTLSYEYRSLAGGWSARLGRQSPTGGGVMGRFDGALLSWVTPLKLKLSGVMGIPTDRYFDSRRNFMGVALDSDRRWTSVGVGAYLVQQHIDGHVDRRALGLDLRWFKPGLSLFTQLDYDLAIGALNIATAQGTAILADNTVFNVLLDRRVLTTLALGNALTFGDPAEPGRLYTRIDDKLASVPLPALREQIKRITPYITQAQLGVTTPLNKHWQAGANVQLTNTGAIPPVPEVAGFENGRPATGNVITTGAQLVGMNLYSARDTQVLALSVISSPSLHGTLLALNSSAYVGGAWQLEPSLQLYRDRTAEGARSRRVTPGLRITYRGWQRWSLESTLTYEIARAWRQTPDAAHPGGTVSTEESSQRINYSLGARYEF